MKITYISKTFQRKSLKMIEQANEIITDYQAQGYDLTLRQLYYQMVSRDYIPNSQRSYKSFGSVISDARLAGLIDWNSIIDRTRITQTNSHWGHPSEIMRSAYKSFGMAMWDDQEYRPRIWIEKDALIGVIQRTCTAYDVPFLACRGYMSQSAMWEDAQQAIREERQGYQPIIIHLGDHDPSGIDMSRDIEDRMNLFGANYIIKRIALNYNQVEEQNPPPNPAKITDTRSGSYIEDFGPFSWELDALAPAYINEILREAIEERINWPNWEKNEKKTAYYKKTLRSISDNYEAIIDFMKSSYLLDEDEG